MNERFFFRSTRLCRWGDSKRGGDEEIILVALRLWTPTPTPFKKRNTAALHETDPSHGPPICSGLGLLSSRSYFFSSAHPQPPDTLTLYLLSLHREYSTANLYSTSMFIPRQPYGHRSHPYAHTAASSSASPAPWRQVPRRDDDADAQHFRRLNGENGHHDNMVVTRGRSIVVTNCPSHKFCIARGKF